MKVAFSLLMWVIIEMAKCIIYTMIKVYDLHNDYLVTLKTNTKIRSYLKNKKLKASVNDIVSAVWTSEMNSEEAMKKIEDSVALLRVLSENENSDTKLHLAIEDMHFTTKNNLAKVVNIAPKYCSLTWNNDNCLAGGALEGGDITTLGYDTIEELEDNNIMVDTAHLSEKSFMSFSRVTKKPFLCSHTAVYSLVASKRNLKDYQIKMIVESGGLMGLALVGDFLTEAKRSTISDVARHIDYIVSRFGDKNICLGTDFYGTKNLPKGVKNYNNLSLLEDRLRFLGYGNETIENIFYKNAQCFFENKNM